MAYPSRSEVSASAKTLGVNQLPVFAFAGLNARVPESKAEINQFMQRAAEFATAIGRPGDNDAVMGFVQARGTWPWSYRAFEDFQVDAGIWDIDRKWTGKIAYPGLGYPPGSSLVGGGDTDEPDGPPPSDIMGWLKSHPLEVGIAAVALFMLMRRK